MSIELGPGGNGAVFTDTFTGLNGLTAVTMSTWILSDDVGSEHGWLTFITPNGSDGSCNIRYDSGGASGGGSNVVKAGINIGNEHNVETISNVQEAGVWQHWVWRWSSGNDIMVFLDGVDVGDTVTGGNVGAIQNTTDIIIGKSSKDIGGTAGFDGMIDDFRGYNRSLSDEEIQTLFASRGKDNISDGLLFRYRFQEDSFGQTVSTAADFIKDDTGQLNLTSNGVGTPEYSSSILNFSNSYF